MDYTDIFIEAFAKAFFGFLLNPFDDQQLEKFLKNLKVPKKEIPQTKEKLKRELAEELYQMVSSNIDMLVEKEEYEAIYAMHLTFYMYYQCDNFLQKMLKMLKECKP